MSYFTKYERQADYMFLFQIIHKMFREDVYVLFVWEKDLSYVSGMRLDHMLKSKDSMIPTQAIRDSKNSSADILQWVVSQ